MKIRSADVVGFIVSNPQKTSVEIGKALGVSKNLVVSHVCKINHSRKLQVLINAKRIRGSTKNHDCRVVYEVINHDTHINNVKDNVHRYTQRIVGEINHTKKLIGASVVCKGVYNRAMIKAIASEATENWMQAIWEEPMKNER